jgi:tRNA(Leu) C34 or U34 (ribose-2'-O)-methylase TrmL
MGEFYMDERIALERIRVVLSRPSHPGNIGAAARAMKTMGLRDLVLVAPRHYPDPDATAMAAGAADLLALSRVHTTLESALADCVLAVGFTSRRRDLSHPQQALREAAPQILAAAQSGLDTLIIEKAANLKIVQLPQFSIMDRGICPNARTEMPMTMVRTAVKCQPDSKVYSMRCQTRFQCAVVGTGRISHKCMNTRARTSF